MVQPTLVKRKNKLNSMYSKKLEKTYKIDIKYKSVIPSKNEVKWMQTRIEANAKMRQHCISY